MGLENNSKTMIVIDLVLDSGELVNIECPEKHEDELFQALGHAIKMDSDWSTHMIDGCSATYLNHILSRVNMKKVVGYL